MKNKIKIYKLNEEEFWAGKSAEDVISFAMQETGLDRDDLVDKTFHELSDDEMKQHQFVYNEDDETGVSFTYRLQEMIDDGMEFPCLFEVHFIKTWNT